MPWLVSCALASSLVSLVSLALASCVKVNRVVVVPLFLLLLLLLLPLVLLLLLLCCSPPRPQGLVRLSSVTASASSTRVTKAPDHFGTQAIDGSGRHPVLVPLVPLAGPWFPWFPWFLFYPDISVSFHFISFHIHFPSLRGMRGKTQRRKEDTRETRAGRRGGRAGRHEALGLSIQTYDI